MRSLGRAVGPGAGIVALVVAFAFHDVLAAAPGQSSRAGRSDRDPRPARGDRYRRPPGDSVVFPWTQRRAILISWYGVGKWSRSGSPVPLEALLANVNGIARGPQNTG
jgi:hypothetical protein